MNEKSIIFTLYSAQNEILKIIKESPEMKEIFEITLQLDRKIREKLKLYPDILELYDELENEELKYISESEINGYYYGFKAGLQIAVEGGLHVD